MRPTQSLRGFLHSVAFDIIPTFLLSDDGPLSPFERRSTKAPSFYRLWAEADLNPLTAKFLDHYFKPNLLTPHRNSAMKTEVIRQSSNL